MAAHQNIGEFTIRRLYAKGKLSLKEIGDAYIEANPSCIPVAPTGSAFPKRRAAAKYRTQVAEGLDADLRFWLALDPAAYRPRLSWEKNPVLVPADVLTSREADVLHQWMDGNLDDIRNLSGQMVLDQRILDGIRWKFGPGWRNRYNSKDIPYRGQT